MNTVQKVGRFMRALTMKMLWWPVVLYVLPLVDSVVKFLRRCYPVFVTVWIAIEWSRRQDMETNINTLTARQADLEYKIQETLDTQSELRGNLSLILKRLQRIEAPFIEMDIMDIFQKDDKVVKELRFLVSDLKTGISGIVAEIPGMKSLVREIMKDDVKVVKELRYVVSDLKNGISEIVAKLPDMKHLIRENSKKIDKVGIIKELRNLVSQFKNKISYNLLMKTIDPAFKFM